MGKLAQLFKISRSFIAPGRNQGAVTVERSLPVVTLEMATFIFHVVARALSALPAVGDPQPDTYDGVIVAASVPIGWHARCTVTR